jgi:hypothetical protein
MELQEIRITSEWVCGACWGRWLNILDTEQAELTNSLNHEQLQRLVRATRFPCYICCRDSKDQDKGPYGVLND